MWLCDRAACNWILAVLHRAKDKKGCQAFQQMLGFIIWISKCIHVTQIISANWYDPTFFFRIISVSITPGCTSFCGVHSISLWNSIELIYKAATWKHPLPLSNLNGCTLSFTPTESLVRGRRQALWEELVIFDYINKLYLIQLNQQQWIEWYDNNWHTRYYRMPLSGCVSCMTDYWLWKTALTSSWHLDIPPRFGSESTITR